MFKTLFKSLFAFPLLSLLFKVLKGILRLASKVAKITLALLGISLIFRFIQDYRNKTTETVGTVNVK